MKHILKYLPALLSLLCIGCTEVIELDLNSSEPQVVIEGSTGNNGDSSIIKISRSINFDVDNIFPTIENALVVISDDLGNFDTLPEVESGLYKSGFSGNSGRTYYLNVLADGKTFSSQSFLPAQVNFDSLKINEVQGSGGGPGGPGGPGGNINHEVIVYFQDPASDKNYYRFVEYRNGKVSTRVFIYDDRLSNGSNIKLTLRGSTGRYDAGDIVTFEMQCIDKPVYEYLNSFSNLNGGPGASSAPANPYTNIEGSKLGYFSAHTVQRLTKVVVP